MQGTRVWSLVLWGDSTCRGTTEPMCHKYCNSCNSSLRATTLRPVHLEPVVHHQRNHHDEKPTHGNEEQPLLSTSRESPRKQRRPSAAKNGGGGLVAKSCPTLSTPWTAACQAPLSMGFTRQKNTGVGCHFLLQGNYPTQESNRSLLHCRQILYQLSYKGSPKWINTLCLQIHM